MSGMVEMKCSITVLSLLFKMSQLYHKINMQVLYKVHRPVVTISKLQIRLVMCPVSENRFNRT
jgi:hypothetical protein